MLFRHRADASPEEVCILCRADGLHPGQQAARGTEMALGIEAGRLSSNRRQVCWPSPAVFPQLEAVRQKVRLHRRSSLRAAGRDNRVALSVISLICSYFIFRSPVRGLVPSPGAGEPKDRVYRRTEGEKSGSRSGRQRA
jgi:hypothetical protein